MPAIRIRARAERPPNRPHVVALAITRQTPIFEFAVPCEVFGIDRSDLVDPWYELRLCAAEPGPLATTAGLPVHPAYGLDDLVAADTVIVLGIPWQELAHYEPPAPLLDALRRAHARGSRIASICSGAYLLAAAGLLDGRRATTHWMVAADLADRYPQVEVDPTVLYVDLGDVLTSAGTGCAIDLCLHLVRRDHGSAVANEVARRMVVSPHRDGGQAQYVPSMACPSAGRPEPTLEFSAVLDWTRRHLDQPLTVDQLAAQARMSPRTFARRFHDTTGTTPLQWLVEQRVRAAQQLLETTDEPVERIAARVGFGTPTSMRQHFRRIASVSPQRYRQVFHHAGGSVGPVGSGG